MEDVAHPTVALHVKDHNLVFVVVSMVAGMSLLCFLWTGDLSPLLIPAQFEFR